VTQSCAAPAYLPVGDDGRERAYPCSGARRAGGPAALLAWYWRFT